MFLVVIMMIRAYKTILHFVSKCQRKESRRSILTYAKGPKVNRLPQQHLFNYHKNYFSVIICIHEPTNAEKLVKFGPGLAEIFGMICRFLHQSV